MVPSWWPRLLGATSYNQHFSQVDNIMSPRILFIDDESDQCKILCLCRIVRHISLWIKKFDVPENVCNFVKISKYQNHVVKFQINSSLEINELSGFYLVRLGWCFTIRLYIVNCKPFCEFYEQRWFALSIFYIYRECIKQNHNINKYSF